MQLKALGIRPEESAGARHYRHHCWTTGGNPLIMSALLP
jgi:phosphoglucomutase